jgi:hypothetical protein
MTLSLRAIEVHPTRAALQADTGPRLPHYAYILENGRTYRFVVGNTDADDGFGTLAPSGGTVGRWKITGRSITTGADLVDGNATITAAGGFVYTLPLATLTGNAALTLSTTSAVEGDAITITRLDVGAFTYAIDNGGPGAGTLTTMAVSVRTFCDARFDGTDWQLMRAGVMP